MLLEYINTNVIIIFHMQCSSVYKLYISVMCSGRQNYLATVFFSYFTYKTFFGKYLFILS